VTVEVVKKVDKRNRLNSGTHPARAHHRGEAFGEVAEHLERYAPSAKHHRSSKLHYVNIGTSKGRADLVTAGEVSRTRSVTEGPHVDDSTDAGS